jgi:chromosome segregation ATPase
MGYNLTPELIAAIVGGVTGFITALAGALIAVSNSHTIRSWMDQKGAIKKAQAELEAKELELRFQKFDEIMDKATEEIKQLKLKVEASELNCAKEREKWINEVGTLNDELLKLASRAASAEAEVKLLHTRQDENIKRIEELREYNHKIILDNQSLRAELNKRGGV